jgi:2-succinyl-5-enolpyruvyl-6-hydroxy-3-cyclohexene-1-carboxylate synthase
MNPPNRNILWAEIIVDELARCGLKSVCIAPGSRSTPLVMAFAAHPAITVCSHLDERSASFFALGLALATDEPVAVLCTSGTATANFFPAIVEAYQSQVPLLILTADRSHELRESGANQTIDQVKMYGDQVLWSVDVALPEADPPGVLIRSLRTLACRAYAKADDLRKGPVHLNFPFRKPLEPTPVPTDKIEIPADALARPDGKPFTQFSRSINKPSDEQIEVLRAAVAHERGVIVCGPHSPVCASRLIDFLRTVSYPILADSLSGLRFDDHVLGGYSSYPIPPNPDVIIRFGAVPTSQRIIDYLGKSNPQYHIHINRGNEWADDNHRVTHFFDITDDSWLATISNVQRAETSWLNQFQTAERIAWEIIHQEMSGGRYFDGALAYDIVSLIPPHSTLFVGNSLPVRLLDQFGKPTRKNVRIYANRGASGIDGVVSSALGTGAAYPGKPLVLFIGDISFYHDMNGLLAIQRCGIPITIVLLNNDGGGIFHMLPIKEFEPTFTDLFITPHGLDFSYAARMYGLDYIRADDRKSFQQVFTESIGSGQSHLIEVRTDARKDLQRRKEIVAAVQDALKLAESNRQPQ